MKFISFDAMTSKKLDEKVNEFLATHQQYEITNMTYTASFGSVFVGIFYKKSANK